MHQINQTNCKNCGSVLHFDREHKLAICEYCSSEYHLDNLGMIEEYKVELEVMGERMTFYINCITVEPEYFELETTCLNEFNNAVVKRNKDTIKLELVSYR